MNKQQVKGIVKNVTGQVQEEAGKLIGSPEQQLKGIGKQIEGRTKKAVGDLKQAAKDAGRK